MKNSLLLLFLIAFSLTSLAQSNTIKRTLNWDETPITYNATGNHALTQWSFEGALYSAKYPSLPIFMERQLVDGPGIVRARLVNTIFEPFDKSFSEDDVFLSENININSQVLNDRGLHYVHFNFIPIRKTIAGSFERLVSFELILDHQPRPVATYRNTYTYESKLSEGIIHKIAVTETGIHKIPYAFFKDELELDNIDPNKISILSNGGGMLPELVGAERFDDLAEVAIQVIDGGDGQFNQGDYVLFFAEGPDKWFFDSNTQTYNRPKNIYSFENHYFIKIGSEDGLRINEQSSFSGTDYTSSAHDSYQRIEEETFNLLNESLGAQGSGRHWYGDPFNPTRERSYGFEFPNLITSEPIRFEVQFAARSKSSSRYEIIAGGQTFQSSAISSVNFTDNERDYARNKKLNDQFNANSNSFNVNIRYSSIGDGTNTGWLDYIQLQGRSNNTLNGAQLIFSDYKTLDYSSSAFQVANSDGNTRIWEVTDPINPKIQMSSLNGSVLSFGSAIDSTLRQYVAFKMNAALPTPTYVNAVANQNIHGIDNVDLLIVYHESFEDAAQNLTQHRTAHSNMDVALVEINQVFNEFGGGSRDITAIRDFAKMLYDRNPQKFKYLLLFGDGTYDFRDITGQGQNFIPTYQTRTSLHAINAFPSDDYFVLLSENEGSDLKGALDIAVGRIPVRTIAEANAVVQKIINYDSSPDYMGDWRNRLTFCADDEDGNRHVNDADAIGEKVRKRHEQFNLNKIYFDAYQQISTPGGDRFPKANEAINRDIFKGSLVMNYLGHGGSKGWAQERVLTNEDIDNWNSSNSLPLLVTATCSFTGYDEPSITTAGEQSILKADGGVIGLFTTTRAVYASANRRLTEAAFDTIFQFPGQPTPTIGEILRVAKNANSADTLNDNARKFALIGDPSLKLAVPKYNVTTTSINGIPLSSGVYDSVLATNIVDTIQALQRVTVEGFVSDYNGNILTDFNGIISPTVYDKVIQARTLSQDNASPEKSFNIQQSIIFRGNASVTNGAFSFTFVVPKDINYDYGLGRISYYAHDGQALDATGVSDNFIIGGTDPNAASDNQGPLVEVFMNNEDFVFGGITNPSPTLIVKLSDDNGINVVGNSIGHDLTGVLNDNTQDTYILNDFYESEKDDYTKGTVRFPLFNLEEGRYTLKAKAWDVANNSGEGYTEFVVAGNEEIALDYVLNYPNPFTTCTNFQFEHNIKDQGLDIQIQIFTISGRIVKTIETQLFTDGGRVSGIKWDGTDDYGDRLGKGVYLYKVKVRSDDQKNSESDFEKLVILK
jgi:hypothetical protein